jgi:hypothetical protein
MNISTETSPRQNIAAGRMALYRIEGIDFSRDHVNYASWRTLLVVLVVLVVVVESQPYDLDEADRSGATPTERRRRRGVAHIILKFN